MPCLAFADSLAFLLCLVHQPTISKTRMPAALTPRMLQQDGRPGQAQLGATTELRILLCCTQTGLERLSNLRVLYASNNKIASWADIAILPQLPALKELLLNGNPLYNEYKDRGETPQYRIEV